MPRHQSFYPNAAYLRRNSAKKSIMHHGEALDDQKMWLIDI
jgi:hypothetical protein